jgi:hypothetical protein
MEMEPEILLLLVRENMLPMSLSWRRGRVFWVATHWHKEKQEESRRKKRREKCGKKDSREGRGGKGRLLRIQIGLLVDPSVHSVTM